MKTKTFAPIIITGITITVFAYALFLILITSPVSNYSINSAGAFGDSFGVLTSLFSGLAFAGVIITILLQKEELKLQRDEITKSREEFAKSTVAKTKSAQLSALSCLLNECIEKKHNIEKRIENLKGLKAIETSQTLIEEKNILNEKIEKLTSITEKIL